MRQKKRVRCRGAVGARAPGGGLVSHKGPWSFPRFPQNGVTTARKKMKQYISCLEHHTESQARRECHQGCWSARTQVMEAGLDSRRLLLGRTRGMDNQHRHGTWTNALPSWQTSGLIPLLPIKQSSYLPRTPQIVYMKQGPTPGLHWSSAGRLKATRPSKD